MPLKKDAVKTLARFLETSCKPANGFEPMAFALQKRCSTAELSRRGREPTGIASLLQRPEQELGAAAAARFLQQAGDVTFDRARTQLQADRDRAVAAPAAELP